MALRFNNDDIDSYLDSQEQERVSNPQLESQEVEEDMGFWGTVGDLAMAPVRGIAGAAEGIYSLADAIAFDILPDAEENFGLGGSETFAGSVIETIVQFGVGFAAPGIGGLSVASKLGKIGKIGKMVDAGNKAVKSQQAAGRYLPALAIARGMEMGKYAVAGAVADFTVFDGHEQRLSNLLQEVPALQNPVTEFLAADEEDPELVGRLKAAIEGAGLGVMVDSVLLGVRAMRAGVKAGPDKKAASIALAERQKELIEEEAKKTATESAEDSAVTATESTVVKTADEPAEEVAARTADDAVADTAEEATTKTTEDLTEDLLNPENMGGTVTDATTVLNRMAKDAQALEESQKRVEGSSRPFRQETDAEYQEEVAKRSIQDREEAIAAAESVDEAAGTQLTLLERQIQNLGEVTGEARERAIEFRYRLGAARQLLTEVGRRADAIAKRVLDPTEATSDRDIAEFLLMQGNFKTLANNLRAVQSEWGRNLQSIQRGTTDTPGAAVVKGIPEEEAIAKYSMKNLDDEQTLAYIIDVAGGRDRIIAEMKLFRAAHENSPAGAMKYLRGKAGMMGAVTEWWMNSILSGPTTMIVNGASGVATTLLAPLEKTMGQALSGNLRHAGVEFGRILALPGEMKEAFKAARTAHKTGRGVLEDVGSRADERASQGGKIEQSIEALTKNIDQENVSIVAAKWLARNVINQPGKLLLGTDEFFKQLNYRTVLKSELYKDGLRQGTRADKLDEYVEKQFDRLVEDNQRVTANVFVKEAQAKFDEADPHYAAKVQKYVQRQMRKFSPLAERALTAAREATFTTPLSRERGMLSGIGKMTSDAVMAYPPLRMVLPFVRTPTNIMQFVMDRVPVVGGGQATQIQHMLRRKFSGEVRALTSNQQAERVEALGRLATGSLFFSGAAIAVMNGGLTGGGPKDYKQRKIKEQTGWQPYSFKVGDTYVSYRRLDPFASFLGIAADLFEVMQHGDEQQRTDAMDIALGATMAISKNIASKTYLKGIQDVAGLLFEPEVNAPGFLNRTIASFAVPNVFAQTARAGDDEMKDIRSLTDALKARIPGLGTYDEVPPRRNMLGEPIHDNGGSMAVDLLNPFSISTVRDNKMMEEFDKIGHGFSTPRSLKNGVELRDYFNSNGQSAYDRWQEMTGQTKIKGRTLKQELTKLMKSAQYKRLPYESMDGVDRSPRARLIQSILTKYRAKAFSEMLREFPEVRERNKIHLMIKTRRTVGRDYQDLLALIED